MKKSADALLNPTTNMPQPTLSHLAELAGMTEEELVTFLYQIRNEKFLQGEQLLALALIKARQREARECFGLHRCDISVRISTLAESLKTGGGE